MLRLVIVLLGCMGMTMTTAVAPTCPAALSALTAATTTIQSTVKMLPGNIMAADSCMINVMYNDPKMHATITLKGKPVLDITFPASPSVNPAGGSGGTPVKTKRQAPLTGMNTRGPLTGMNTGAPMAAPPPMPTGCMLWIIDPITCQSYAWANITDQTMAMTYISSIHDGAILLGAMPPMANVMSMFGQYMLMQPTMMPMKTAPNTKMTGKPMDIYEVFLFQKGYPEKTIIAPFTTGMSMATQISITGNILYLNIKSTAPAVMPSMT